MDIFYDLIANLGFPIAVCIAFFFLFKDVTDKHKAEVGELTKVVDACSLQVNTCLAVTEAANATLHEVKVVVENNNRLFDIIASALNDKETAE